MHQAEWELARQERPLVRIDPTAMSAPYDIDEVEYLGGHRLRLTFADGLVSEVDLAARLTRDIGLVFEPLRDTAYFAQVRVDHELGTIVWPNGADFAPDVLHRKGAPVR